MEKDLTFQNSKGNKLAAILTDTGNRNFALVMAHGFPSNKNTKNNITLAKRLAKKGIGSFRFDFFGMGESDGNFADITISEAVDDTLQAIAYVKKQDYKHIGLLGSSFGGFVSLLATAKISDLAFLALKSPVSDYLALEKYYFTQAQLEDWKKRGYREVDDHGQQKKLNYFFFTDLQKHDGYAAARKITIPTLIVHGNKDEIVPYSQSQKLVKKLSNGTLVTIDRANHRFTTSPAHTSQMLSAITNFVVKQGQ